MIREMTPLSLAEAQELVEDEEVKAAMKKFVKIKTADALKLKKELEELNSIKVRGEHIAKIIDIMPEDSQDLAKIFVDINLDENESSKILEIVKKYN